METIIANKKNLNLQNSESIATLHAQFSDFVIFYHSIPTKNKINE